MNISTSFRINYICLTAAVGGILFGFDTAVISGAINLVKAQYLLGSILEGWLVSSGLAGCIFGVILTGFLSDKIGRKKTMILAGSMFFLSGMACAFAGSMPLLIAGRIIGGAGVGMASVVSPMYIAEFAPAEKRGRMIALYQLAITIGILLAYFSNALFISFSKNDFNEAGFTWFFKDETWRPMFLAMSFPSLIFLFMMIKIPESPRWLVSVNRTKKAAEILALIRPPAQAAKELEDIENASRKSFINKTSLLDKSVRLPLIIGIVLAVLQQFSGINAIIYYGPSIFKSAGIADDNALVFQVILGAVNLLFTFVAIRFADKYGRKSLLVAGLTGIIFSLIASGYLFYTGNTHNLWLLVFIISFIACFAFSLGPITWILINEIFPTAVRVKAVAICTLSLWVAVWIVGQFFPWILEKAGPATTFWIFALFSVINLFFSLRVVKETKGKSLEEMEAVFFAPH
ncbi:MAG: transporter [Mucilaginibacter sp.]|nr:transporter [Mucilaginibacter sp.]